MSITFECTPFDTHLEVVTHGQDDGVESVRAYQRQLRHQVRAHGLRRILCDERELEYRLSDVETFEIVESFVTDARQAERVALVVSEDVGEDAMRFIESLYQNRAVPLRLFSERDRAREWLLS